jgi:hypothetical protein
MIVDRLHAGRIFGGDDEGLGLALIGNALTLPRRRP